MRRTLLVALAIVLSGCALVQPGPTGGNQSLSATFDAGRCEIGAAPGAGLDDGRGGYQLELANDSAAAVEQYVRAFERTYAYKAYHGRTYDNFSVWLSDAVVDAGDGTATVTVERVNVVGRRNGTIAEDSYSVTYRLTEDGATRNESRPERPPPAATHDFVVECGET